MTKDQQIKVARPKVIFMKSLLLTILLPGTVVVYIPYLIAGAIGDLNVPRWKAPQVAGLILIGSGVISFVHCIGVFARVGHGTLAPFDPPKHLVVKGLYRYMRNPMYFGVLLMLSGEAIVFESTALVVYAAIWFVMANVLVTGYEEPKLRDAFGDSYDRYCRVVNRWIPLPPGRASLERSARKGPRS